MKSRPKSASRVSQVRSSSHMAKKPLQERVVDRSSRKIAFIVFAAIVLLMGGGSRYDIYSLVILRPLAVLFGAYALIALPRQHLTIFRAPLFLLLSLFSWCLIQLIPLPPGLWKMLPMREIYSELAQLAGLSDPWRPISVSPSRTLNSLLALLVPLAGLLLFIALDARDRATALLVIIVFALASAALGALQMMGSAHGPLYFYSVTNYGLPVGLFANRNHQAVFLASIVPLATIWFLGRSRNKVAGATFAFATGVFFALIVLLAGSRAGLVAVALAIPVALVLGHSISSFTLFSSLSTRSKWAVSGGALALVGLFAIMVVRNKRALAIDRLLATENGLEDIRGEMLPILIDMAAQYFPLGAGMGAFERAFYQFETPLIMQNTYLNHAHNDWVQLIIEAGVPGVAIFAAALVWVIVTAVKTVRRLGWNAKSAAFSAMIFAILLYILASAVDYPLRTPAMMVVLVWLMALVAEPSSIYFFAARQSRALRQR